MSSTGNRTRPPGLALAAGLFSVVPMPPVTDLTRADARRALTWLPTLGLVIGAAAGLVGGAALWLSDAQLLAAVLAVVTIQALVGAMHLDGLADSADGLAALGSRKAGRDAARAMAVMRAPDTGAMGVVAIAGVLLVDVAALAAAPGPRSLLVLAALAGLTGRLAMLTATRPGVPAARPDGFGALFAGAALSLQVVAQSICGALLAAVAGWWLGGWSAAVGLVVALLVAQTVTVIWTGWLVRVLGGLTGDLFGAISELSAAVFLVAAGAWMSAAGS